MDRRVFVKNVHEINFIVVEHSFVIDLHCVWSCGAAPAGAAKSLISSTSLGVVSLLLRPPAAAGRHSI